MDRFITMEKGRVSPPKKETQKTREYKSDGKKHAYVVMAGNYGVHESGQGMTEDFLVLEEYGEWENAINKYYKCDKMQFKRIEYYVDGQRVGEIKPL